MKWLRLFLEIAIALLLIGGGVFAVTTYATSTYNSGYATGHRLGYQSGHADGHRAGYTDGKSYGYSQGYEDGHNEGQGTGYSDGIVQGNAQALQQIFDWIVGSNCEQSLYSGYIYFDLWKDSNGQMHYTCLV